MNHRGQRPKAAHSFTDLRITLNIQPLLFIIIQMSQQDKTCLKYTLRTSCECLCPLLVLLSA